MTSIRRKFIKFLMSVIFFLLISGIVDIDTVLAKDVEVDAWGNEINVGTCSKGWCWSTNDINYAYYGVRISIYDYNGTKISKSLDFAPNNYDRSLFESVELRASGQKKSKLEYISSGVASHASWSGYDMDSLITGTMNIADLFPEVGGSSNIFADKLGMYDQDSITAVLGAYESDFFSSGGHTIAGLFENADKYYIVIEPITIIEYNKSGGGKTYYYGTYAELLKIYNSEHTASDFYIKSLFEKGNAIGNSIYLGSEINVGSDSFASTINSLKSVTNATTIANKYGIGVMWLNKYTPPPIPESGNCDVSQTVNPCNGSITYEYRNCVINPSHEVFYGEDDTTICKIACGEKYHIESWRFKNVFNKIQAGKYVSVNDLRVYHKKQCKYTKDFETLDAMIENDKNTKCILECHTTYCDVVSGSEVTQEPCGQTCNYEEYDACKLFYDDLREEIKEQCNEMEDEYKSWDAESFASEDADEQGDLTLNTGFSEYTMIPELEKTVTEPTDPDLGKFYFHNTFKYKLENDETNKFIGMDTVHQGLGVFSEITYDNNNSMITTPLKASPGGYEYIVDYSNVLNSEFKSIMNSNGVYFDEIEEASCPYTLVGRNIKTYCEEDCGDPDNEFDMPEISLAFRPIDLQTPFPGKNFAGVQRTPGPNWTTDDIKTYITDTVDVYSEEPIYVIELDSAAINAIREYNDYNDYDDFTLECTAGKGTECLSTFLRDYDLITDGKCNTSDRSKFYSCAGK